MRCNIRSVSCHDINSSKVWITSVFIIISVTFTVLAWMNIRKLKQEILERQMISRGDQLARRLKEERRWFTQSCLILLGFLVSLSPIFMFYLLSVTSRLQLLPAFSLLSWILFFSGASYNFIIYNFLNPQFRKKFIQVFYRNKRESRSKNTSTSTRFTFFSRSSKNVSSENQQNRRTRKNESEILMKDTKTEQPAGANILEESNENIEKTDTL